VECYIWRSASCSSRANMAHVRPGSGLGFQVKVRKTFHAVLCLYRPPLLSRFECYRRRSAPCSSGVPPSCVTTCFRLTIEGLSDLWQEYPFLKKQKCLGHHSRKSMRPVLAASPRAASLPASGFRVQGSGFRVQGSGFRAEGLALSVQGSGRRV